MERQHGNLLAEVEKQCLVWLAERMPRSVQPDHLTLLALASMFMAGVSYAAAQWWSPGLLMVNAWLAVNWFGDSLDGTLARVRRQERPRYGFYVDHMADSIGVLFLLGGLALSGYMRPGVAFALLIIYLLLSINLSLAAYSLGIFQLSFWLFGPTELRILLGVGNVVAWLRPTVHVLGIEPALLRCSGPGRGCGHGVGIGGLSRAEHLGVVPERKSVMRWLKFNAVGAMGMTVQLTTLAVGVHLLELHYILATLLSVEAALLHNFVWHATWTWPAHTAQHRWPLGSLLRFQLIAGTVSIAGNTGFMWILVGNGTAGTGPRQPAVYRGMFTRELCRVQPFRICFARGFQFADTTWKRPNKFRHRRNRHIPVSNWIEALMHLPLSLCVRHRCPSDAVTGAGTAA